MKANLSRQSAFTLVELVVVIILLGILSVYAASRYIGSSGFSAYAAQEQAIAIIRQIQLGRMQSNISETDTLSSEYRLSITSDCLGSVASCSSTDESRSNNLVLPDDVSFTPARVVDFNLLGAPTAGALKIDISSDTDSVSVCINSEGYVYEC